MPSAPVSRHAPVWRWLRPLVLALACAAGCVGMWWFFVTTTHGAVIDELAYRGANIGSRHLSGRGEELLSVVSVKGVAVVMAAVALTALLRRRWLLALEAAIVVAGANVTTRVLKYHIFYRPAEFGWGNFALNSFPSGHTTAAGSAMVAALLVVPPRLRSTMAYLGALVMVVFGYATVVAHWHRPADVIGGYLVCFAWACAGLAVAALRQALVGRTRGEVLDVDRPSRTAPGLLVGAGMVALAVAAVCFVRSWSVGLVNPTLAAQFVAYLGASAGICGAAVTGMGVLLRLVQLQDARAQQLI